MYHKSQRIAALLAIVLLVLLYIVTLVCAIFNFDGTGRLFQACLFATIAVPILIWIYIWLFGKLTGKHTMADFNNAETADETNSDKEKAVNLQAKAAESITISKRNKK